MADASAEGRQFAQPQWAGGMTVATITGRSIARAGAAAAETRLEGPGWDPHALAPFACGSSRAPAFVCRCAGV